MNVRPQDRRFTLGHLLLAMTALCCALALIVAWPAIGTLATVIGLLVFVYAAPRHPVARVIRLGLRAAAWAYFGVLVMFWLLMQFGLRSRQEFLGPAALIGGALGGVAVFVVILVATYLRRRSDQNETAERTARKDQHA